VAEGLSSWLALREAADARSRSDALVQELCSRLPPQRPLRILDLGSGTGSNIRYLESRLPRPQDWIAVDRDGALLARSPAFVSTRVAELGALDDGSLFAGRHVVTASALLDLVSERWLGELAAHCREAGAAVLFALTYDGRSWCEPREPEDEEIRRLFNQHQRGSDKGFGRAAGPDAVEAAAGAFSAAGYQLRRVRTDWQAAPDESAFQRELVRGWAEAAAEIEPGRTRYIDDWFARRLAHIDAGRSSIGVGHEDLAGWLPVPR
jgi:hypothetical protein